MNQFFLMNKFVDFKWKSTIPELKFHKSNILPGKKNKRKHLKT